MADPTIAEKFHQSTQIAITDALRRHGINLPPPQDSEAFGEAFAGFGDARIVLLGEATHGSAEFYQARAAITRHLIERHGFTIVAVIMYRGSRESWNLRDRHMFETLEALVDRRGDGRAVVWAHNSHIGNAAATAMGWAGEFNIGELCRTTDGDDAILIGFGTDRGTVAAASDWDAPMEIKSVRPARADSYEYAFRKAGLSRSLTAWRGAARSALSDVLGQSMLERAIGVIYRPESELASHYFEAVLAEQFDAYVWFEETRAVTPLPAARPHGVPETYPFGL
jgi:erythromycin esterase-like protein